MVALKAGEVEAFVARPDASRPIVLVFGPDLGLVRERAEAVIRASVDDPGDPFALARLDGDDLAADPMRLVDEAQTVPLFGGRRAIHVRAGGKNVTGAIEALLAMKIQDCRVVIEAGDLKRNAPLRTLCEAAANVATIGCYPDGERDLARLVEAEMRTAGLTISADARAALVPLLGGDRRASLSEIRKLALYAHGSGQVELDDVLAVVADASALGADRLVDAAFAGRTAEVEAEFVKARTAGTAPGTILAAALRQVAGLHRARLGMESGASADQAVRDMRPPVHFSRATLVQAALKNWTCARLERAMAQLADAALEARRQSGLGEAIAQRTLMSIAGAARRKG